MSAAPNHRPERPLDAYPAAELPPLPPEAAPGEAASATADAPKPKPFEVAVLRFLDPSALATSVTLQFPFEWEGREVRAIELRRLSVAEVGAVMAAIPEGEDYDVNVFVAAMCGLPASVLRALIEDDAVEVLAKARPLLPRKVAAVFFTPTPETGAASPSPPPAG